MKLIYFQNRVPNFGDDLNRDLWPALVPALFEADPGTGFVGIGTIIGMPCEGVDRLHVFSSGAGYDPPDRWRGKQVEYWCVRGPLSARVLGLPSDRAASDGAILAPLAPGFPQRATGAGGTAVVPHWESLGFPGWTEAAGMAGFELVDPRGEPRDVVARIAASRLVLTESLHGAILADTYGIPWIAFATSQNFSVFKWTDWTSSVGLQLAFAGVPPPSPGPLPRFGRPPRPYGAFARHDADSAMAGFAARQASAPRTVASRLKGAVARSPLIGPLLGLSPARTAEALTALSRAAPNGSAEPRRQELQSRLMDRLGQLRAAYRPG